MTAGGTLYLSAATPAFGIEPWVDGIGPGGPRLLLDVVPGPCSSNPDFFTEFGATVIFRADDQIHGN
jgi:ELWxxDGT repeat protein